MKKKKKIYKVWTESEENVVLEEIGKNPTNLKHCFFMASCAINRSAGAISNHYYTKMAKDPNVVAFITVGRTSVVKNRKRLKPYEKPTPIYRKVWDRVVRLLFN